MLLLSVKKYGVNIVYIRRGDKIYHIPGRNQILLPFDEVGVLTTDEQIQVFKSVFESPVVDDTEHTSLDDIGVFQLTITEHHWLNGKSIRSSGIREKALGLVAGIERNGERILNPDSTMIFQTDDLVWIVGNVKKMKELKI